jgi:hypothetical protein
MPERVMAVPVGVAFLEQKGNASHHQTGGANQVDAQGFLEGNNGEASPHKRCGGKDNGFPGGAQVPQGEQV